MALTGEPNQPTGGLRPSVQDKKAW